MQQKQIIGVDFFQCQIQRLAVRNMADFLARGRPFNQVDPVERTQVIETGIRRIVVHHPHRNALFLDMLTQKLEAHSGDVRGFVIYQDKAEIRRWLGW
ncbi:hypothetical protein D3C81_2110450 [compost metagenome]